MSAIYIATSYRLEPAIEQAISAHTLATSVILGEPPFSRELLELVLAGAAAVANLDILPVDAAAEARLEKLLAAKRGTPARKPLKTK